MGWYVVHILTIPTSINTDTLTVSVFGFISLGLIPIPLIFIRYGPSFRARSHFASEARRVAAQMHAQQEEIVGEAEGEQKKGDIESGQVQVLAAETVNVNGIPPSAESGEKRPEVHQLEKL